MCKKMHLFHFISVKGNSKLLSNLDISKAHIIYSFCSVKHTFSQSQIFMYCTHQFNTYKMLSSANEPQAPSVQNIMMKREKKILHILKHFNVNKSWQSFQISYFFLKHLMLARRNVTWIFTKPNLGSSKHTWINS